MYTLTLLKKELVADNTMAFHFAKPEGFTHLAGQYGDFTLIDPSETDSEGNKRTFSIASAPFEPELVFTTRLRDTAFKRVLQSIPEGGNITLEGPFGSLALPKTPERPIVFLTGGIGATLVRSMITQATHDNAPHKITFLYSNHTSKDAVFMDTFTTLTKQNPNFTFVPTMTDDPNWNGEHGPITLEMLQKYVGDIMKPIYFLSGPGEMVGAMRRMLMAAGVDRTLVRSDLFIGY